MNLREALEEIAREDKVATGHGNYEIVPAYTAAQMQDIAKRALMGMPQCEGPTAVETERMVIARLRRHPFYVGRFKAEHWPTYKLAIADWHRAYPPRSKRMENQVSFRSNAPHVIGLGTAHRFYNLFIGLDVLFANEEVKTKEQKLALKRVMTTLFIKKFLLPRLRQRGKK